MYLHESFKLKTPSKASLTSDESALATSPLSEIASISSGTSTLYDINQVSPDVLSITTCTDSQANNLSKLASKTPASVEKTVSYEVERSYKTAEVSQDIRDLFTLSKKGISDNPSQKKKEIQQLLKNFRKHKLRFTAQLHKLEDSQQDCKIICAIPKKKHISFTLSSERIKGHKMRPAHHRPIKSHETSDTQTSNFIQHRIRKGYGSDLIETPTEKVRRLHLLAYRLKVSEDKLRQIQKTLDQLRMRTKSK
ncbi:hypothetical protein BC833DRAFT_616956 [Globomyces pollinis-pini]|nr:hypothetical protein BC833DRAFT_616956 [Globomyces pollinis-pini]